MSSNPHSPIRSSKRPAIHSTPRRPLQQKSDSDFNWKEKTIAPTIRVVADLNSNAYSKSPFPSLPAHFLPPSKVKSYRTLYEEKAAASDENALTFGTTSTATLPVSIPARNTSTSHSYRSDDETLANSRNSLSPSFSLSSRFSHHASYLSTPTLTSLAHFAVEDDERNISTSNSHSKLSALLEDTSSTIRLVPQDSPPPSTSHSNAASQLKNSTSRAIARETSPNFQVVPNSSTPSSPTSDIAPAQFGLGLDLVTLAQDDNLSSRPVSEVQQENLLPASSLPSSPTTPIQVSLPPIALSQPPPPPPSSPPLPPSTSHSNADTLPELQYPIIRQASASHRSWVTSEPSPGLRDNLKHISMGSSHQSVDTTDSEPLPGPPSPKLRREKRNIAFATPTSTHTAGQSSRHISSDIPVPPPLFSKSRAGVTVSGQGKHDVLEDPSEDEDEDTLGDIVTPQIKPKRSGYLARMRSLTRPSSSESMKSEMSMRSELSFQGDHLSWVRTFYKAGQFPSQHSLYALPDASMSRLNTGVSGPSASYITLGSIGSTTSPVNEAFSAEIFRPRNRPRLLSIIRKSSRRSNTVRVHAPSTVSSSTDDILRVPVRGGHPALKSGSRSGTKRNSWTQGVHRPIWGSESLGSVFGVFAPRLHRDRRNSHTLASWSVPSIDSHFFPEILSPVNRQVALFCVGFLMPLAWFLAAFLPLPHRPSSFDVADESGVIPPGTGPYGVARADGVSMEISEKQFLKTQWWRTLNRIMCAVGLIVIGAIIGLVVVATKA